MFRETANIQLFLSFISNSLEYNLLLHLGDARLARENFSYLVESQVNRFSFAYYIA